MKKTILMILTVAAITGCQKENSELPANFAATYTQVDQVINGNYNRLDGVLQLTTTGSDVLFELTGNNTFRIDGVVNGNGKATIIAVNGVGVTGSANYNSDYCDLIYTTSNGVEQVVKSKK